MMKNLIKDGLIDNEETFLIVKLMDTEEFDDGVPEHPDVADIGVTAKLEDGSIVQADVDQYNLVGTAKNPYGYWIKKEEEMKSCIAVFYSKQQCSIKNLILTPLRGNVMSMTVSCFVKKLKIYSLQQRHVKTVDAIMRE